MSMAMSMAMAVAMSICPKGLGRGGQGIDAAAMDPKMSEARSMEMAVSMAFSAASIN